MLSLGIWAFGRDSSAVLVDETSIVAAIEEEKLSRFAGTGGIPRVAVARCSRTGRRNNSGRSDGCVSPSPPH